MADKSVPTATTAIIVTTPTTATTATTAATATTARASTATIGDTGIQVTWVKDQYYTADRYHSGTSGASMAFSHGGYILHGRNLE